MPQGKRKGAPHAQALSVSTANNSFKNRGRRMAGPMLPDDDHQRHCSRRSNRRTAVPVRAARLSPYGDQCNGSASLRDQPGIRTSSERRATRGNTVHAKHTIYARPQRWLKRASHRWLEIVQEFAASNADRRSGEQLSGSEGKIQRANHRHGPTGNIRSVDRLLRSALNTINRVIRCLKVPILWLILAALVPVGAANAAASLVIRPTRIIVTQAEPTVAISIQNTGNTEAVIQLQMMSWSQPNGEDVYTPTDDLEIMACPPLFTVQAGESQIVRVGLEAFERDWSTEGAFRLFIQEIPPAPVEGENAVQVAVRIGVPVFLPPQNAVQPTLDWHIENRDADGLWMTVNNTGTLHALVSGLQLTGAGNDAFVFETATHQYVLPGSTVSWRLDTTKPITGTIPNVVEATFATDQGAYQETLTIAK